MMHDRDDETALIRAGLCDDLERLLDTYCPGWMMHRGKGFLAPKGKGDLGSWAVDLAGARRGLWYRHSQGVGGDALALLAYCLTGAPRPTAAVFDEARAFLGIAGRPDPAEAARRRAEADARRREQERVAAEERLRSARRARDIWRASGDAARSPVAAWLAARVGADYVIPPTIRAHPALPYWWDAPRRTGDAPRREIIHAGPAMVALVTDGVTGRFRGVHITWLSADGATKATITAPDGTACLVRKMRGSIEGGHVRLGPPGPVMAIAEGIETAAVVALASGLPVFAALSLGNLDAALPPLVRDLTLCADSDEAYRLAAPAARGRMVDPDAVLDHAIAAHAGRGLTVRLARPPLGLDFRDWWTGDAGKRRSDLPLPPGLSPTGEEARA